MRLSQCGFGCSLRNGTLIILLLELIFNAYVIFKQSVVDSSPVIQIPYSGAVLQGHGFLVFVITILGIIGVYKHQPRYLLPYVCTMLIRLILCIIITVCLWVGSLVIQRAFDTIGSLFSTSNHLENILKPDEIRKKYKDLLFTRTVILLFVLALTFYFYSVVHSYYKQLQEENKGIYKPPSGTGTKCTTQWDKPRTMFV